MTIIADENTTPVKNKEIAKDTTGLWGTVIKRIKLPLEKLIVTMTKFSALNPYTTVFLSVIISFGIISAGIFTNFRLETNNVVLYSPSGSVRSNQSNWVGDPKQSGFPRNTRKIAAILHANGENILHIDGLNRTFEMIDMVRNMEGYSDICKIEAGEISNRKCEILSPTGFWDNHDHSEFDEMVETSQDLKKALSKFRFANGDFVNRDFIIGNPEPYLTVDDFQLFLTKESFGLLTAGVDDIYDKEFQRKILDKAAEEFELKSVQSFMITMALPDVGPEKQLAKEFEIEATKNILALNEKWAENGEEYSISVTCRGCSNKEVLRGIFDDVPLLLGAFILMTAFTSYMLSPFHRVKSQVSLGIGAIFCIFLSLITGYGFMFLIGIPLTPLTCLFPYVLLGLGLDSTFIITEAYKRTDQNIDVVERITYTIKDIGISITMSTLTTTIAYFLGSSSAMAGVSWFCLYAAVVILCNLMYQLTFYVALISLDDRRQKSNRIDVICCCKSKTFENVGNTSGANSGHTNLRCSDKIVENYAYFLLKPLTKIFVLILFSGMLGAGIWYGQGIESSLLVQDLLPPNSYVLDYLLDMEKYGGRNPVNYQIVGVYFRDVDVSKQDVRDQMTNYVDNLVDLQFISSPPLSFWLRDFSFWINGNKYAQKLDFNSQINLFLTIPEYKHLHSDNIVRDGRGSIISSRTFLIFDNVDPYDVNDQRRAFNSQLNVTKQQPINNGSTNAHFFTNGGIYSVWEVWDILPKELTSNVVLALSTIFIICLFSIPHPTGALLLTPLVAATFIEIVAVFRLSGIYMNAPTAIGLITCLGLVVDYSIHICLAYFEIHDAESRNERVHKVLTTMGKSILKGGLTTFLGVLPLSFNSSLGFRTMFITFIGITTLGVAHGLVLLPVLLSYVGPMKKKRRQFDSDLILEEVNHNDKDNVLMNRSPALNSDNSYLAKLSFRKEIAPPAIAFSSRSIFNEDRTDSDISGRMFIDGIATERAAMLDPTTDYNGKNILKSNFLPGLKNVGLFDSLAAISERTNSESQSSNLAQLEGYQTQEVDMQADLEASKR